MDADEMPLPPAFMWACPACVTFLDTLTDAFDLAEVDPFHDGALRTQIALCQHLTAEHPAEVPAPHDDGCAICVSYARSPDDDRLWSEHRARELFLPPGAARLL